MSSTFLVASLLKVLKASLCHLHCDDICFEGIKQLLCHTALLWALRQFNANHALLNDALAGFYEALVRE